METSIFSSSPVSGVPQQPHRPRLKRVVSPRITLEIKVQALMKQAAN